jgi:short-subunit dehydrogenase
MVHGEGGHIVNTSSIAGMFVSGNIGVYAAYKFAVVGLSEALRLDLEPYNIGVSVLRPGFGFQGRSSEKIRGHFGGCA